MTNVWFYFDDLLMPALCGYKLSAWHFRSGVLDSEFIFFWIANIYRQYSDLVFSSGLVN